MITSINGYVNKYYSNEKFYDLIVFNSDAKATDALINWCKNNSKVNDIKAMDAFSSGNDLYNGKKDLKLALYNVIPLEDMKKVPYGLNKITPSDKAVCPKEGEVWINRLTADNFKLKVGNFLTFHMQDKIVKLKISSLINDSLQPSSLMSMTNFYINSNNVGDFHSFTKQPLVLIDAKKGTSLSKLQKDLTDNVNPGGFLFDKYVLSQNATTISSTVGGICTLASLLVFIVSILLIRFILWNNILKEYKSIGIYKALGFTKREINGFYIIGYALTAVSGSVIGAFCSIPILNYTASKVLKYVGDFNGASINYTVIFLTIFLFSLVVIINLYLVIRKTNKISPVAALRTGITSSRKKLTKSLVKNTISPFALAVNDILKYKKNSVYLTMALTLPLTLVLFFGNFNVTVSKMKDNSNIWFGLPKSNVTVSASITSPAGSLKNVLKMIKKNPRVKN
ncbi:MAG TPA: ABC transporter permease, partial [Clostridia bacterium]|nr:ABC transporter permease [Clostridia bacterium]